MASDYHFVTVWRVPGTIAEVKDVLGNADTLPEWWPSVYLKVTRLDEGSGPPDWVGSVNRLHTKGWLPYTLSWDLKLDRAHHRRRLRHRGHRRPQGPRIWTFAQEGPEVVITYDWRIEATKPLLRRLAFVLKPAFAANHKWAMAKGQESLELEMRRRRATSDEERRAIPPPPPATFRRLLRT